MAAIVDGWLVLSNTNSSYKGQFANSTLLVWYSDVLLSYDQRTKGRSPCLPADSTLCWGTEVQFIDMRSR